MQVESDKTKNTKVQNKYPLSDELILENELNINKISIHHSRIMQALNNETNTTIPIMGACTTNNGGIISWKLVTRLLSTTFHPSLRKFQKNSLRYWRENYLLTCIPAAGAASRFFTDLEKFVLGIDNKIPEFKNSFNLFLNDKNKLELTLKSRKNIQEILQNTKISPELSSLYDGLLEQDDEEIKAYSKHFYYYLSKLLISGNVDKKNLQNTILQTQSSLDFSKKEFTKSIAHSESIVRTPWEYNKNIGKSKYSEINSNLNNEIYHNSDSITSHWMDRITPQTLFARKELNTSQEPSVYLSAHEENILKTYSACCLMLNKYSNLPKALVPTTSEGDSFLMLKLAEQIGLLPCLGNILVVPAFMKSEFEKEIELLKPQLQENVSDIFALRNSPFAPLWLKENRKTSGAWAVLEQGRNLSTIRFHMDGRPYTDENGKYIPVSAGHGELIHLFDEITNNFPDAECLHIRNIDNVIGSSLDRSSELNIPAECFKIIRDCIEFLRAQVEDYLFDYIKNQSNNRLQNETTFHVLRYLANFIDDNIANEALDACVDEKLTFTGVPYPSLHKILGNLFHWQPLTPHSTDFEAWEQTMQWLEKPISVFGVVRKEVADVGGGPVFAALPDGTTIKLCLEMPHANEEDAREYFGPRGKATHFNPVLAFFELKTHTRAFESTPSIGKKVEFSKLFDERFWLLSKKEYKGTPVCYHETVLHELIGNSATTNLVFIEVPRTLFRPHKSYFDSLGNDRRTYGFDETLATTETRNF
ncbi:DUF4301 family protein [Fluviispira multicolorata]|uniref:DUF4301 family protein n=1 Tax=Fluviispira multicolorata TaxID=2654512 RepID=A0A833JHH4_9BACT|nr:DUF4301 family protein [Fluviispira multicolorata]KAB8033407.1 DUF4301 family protein [Fluviispira multicolorata]